MLKCSKCKEELPVDSFSKKNDSKRGYSYKCKRCHNEYCKNTWYPKNIGKQVDSSKKIKLRNLEFSWRYKKMCGCKICKETNPIVLEYDHLVPSNKEFTVSKMLQDGYSLKKIKEEIRKCQILCANCHVIKTSADFNWFTI